MEAHPVNNRQCDHAKDTRVNKIIPDQDFMEIKTGHYEVRKGKGSKDKTAIKHQNNPPRNRLAV
jgi:hypothetical protein